MDWMRQTLAKKENQVHAAEQVARFHRYQICTLNSVHYELMSTVFPVSTEYKHIFLFTAARDSRSPREEDPDAREAGETCISKASHPLQNCFLSMLASNSVFFLPSLGQ